MQQRPSGIGLLVSLCLGLVSLAACDDTPEPTDGDGDADADIVECDESWECCLDTDCSDGVFCNGLEVCDQGVCRDSPPPDCDDGVECTVDDCNEDANVCVHNPDDSVCVDEDICNGEETCSPMDADADDMTGCLAGHPVVCDDGDDCTQEECVDNACVATIRDNDGDGFGDRSCAICDPDDPTDCEYGTDCNDGNADVYPGAPEICDDGEDNNCDRVTDYADPSCVVPNDSCDTAMAITPGVVVDGSTRGTTGDIASGCSPDEDLDVAFTFNLSEPRDVEITVSTTRRQDLTLALTASCGDAEADLKCTTGQSFTQMNRALPAGDYVLVVSAPIEVDFTILVEDAEPVPRPEGDQCESAVDVSAGGTFTGSTTGADPDYEVSCSVVDALDTTFFIDVPETSSAEVRAEAGVNPLAIGVQSTCGIAATEAACFAGVPAEGWVRHLAPGRYYLIVQSLGEVDFTLEVTFMPTSADTCADALDVTSSIGSALRGTTVGMSADIDTACGPGTGPDSVYRFTLTEAQDVTVDFASSGEATTLSLTSDCSVPDAELRCATGEAFQLVARDTPAGTYDLVATGREGADFELTVTTSDPTTGVVNDLCEDALDLPAGAFAPDTTDALDDYDTTCGGIGQIDVAYVFEVTEPQSLDVILTAGAGPVTAAVQPACGVAGTELTCLTTDSSTHRRVRNLDPGTYYLVLESALPEAFGVELVFGDPLPMALEPVVPYDDHTEVTLSGMPFAGQYNIDISPLAFPFDGQTFDSVAVSVNGFIRFGNGSFPSSAGSADAQTDIDDIYPEKAQFSWLGGEGMSGTIVTYDIDTDLERVTITYIDHSRQGLYGANDLQFILFCDTGDIQVSYIDCLFGNPAGAHWSIGVSEPFYLSGVLQGHDFTTHVSGTVESFGPGAIAQEPEHEGPAPYLPLNERGILFARQGPGWSVLVDELP